MSDVVTPTFIIGGAPKAGTTSLYHYLAQHPQVCMSARKETSVFIDDMGLKWLSEKYYRHYEGEPAVGEASAGTLGNPDVAGRVHDALPEVKLIFVLRDPVERLHSHFAFLQSVQAIEKSISFSQLIRSDVELRNDLISLGRYHRHLTRFENYFDRDQMLILLFADLTENTPDVIEQVYRFVGVEPSFRPDFEIHNSTRFPRFDRLHRVLSRSWDFVKEHLDVYLINRTRPVRRVVKRFLTKDLDRGGVSVEDAEYLREIYERPNKRLEDWLGRDLSHWRYME